MKSIMQTFLNYFMRSILSLANHLVPGVCYLLVFRFFYPIAQSINTHFLTTHNKKLCLILAGCQDCWWRMSLTCQVQNIPTFHGNLMTEGENKAGKEGGIKLQANTQVENTFWHQRIKIVEDVSLLFDSLHPQSLYNHLFLNEVKLKKNFWYLQVCCWMIT